MTGTQQVMLPRVSALVLADAVDALPARLRKKLDDAVLRAASWPVEADGNTFLVRVDDATTVTLVTDAGVVRSAADAVCSCLLAPNCLHRVALLAAAQTGEPDSPAENDQSDEVAGSAAATADPARATAAGTEPESDGGAQVTNAAGTPQQPAEGEAAAADQDALSSPVGIRLTDQQTAAVGGLWRAGVAVLEAGVSGSGVVLRTALLRAVHEARTHGLHSAAAAGTRVATALHAARIGEPQYRLAGLTDELRELLAGTHALRGAGARPTALGTARRSYDPQAGLRLYGLCTVPVVADSGYAGVITYLVDRAGKLWGVGDLMPGDAGRAAGVGDATVALGEASISHRALTRAGLIVSGGTASAVGMLGAGKSVKAARVSGVAWTAEPLASLWIQPLAEQIGRAFAALALPVVDRPVGADLVFLSVTVLGAGPDGVLAQTADAGTLTLSVAIDVPALPFRDNLRVLGSAVGARLLVVGRPDPGRRATVQALSVAVVDDHTDPEAGAGRLRLPESWAGHVDLGYDRLHSSHLTAPAAGLSLDVSAASTTTDPALELMRRHLERVVAGGRAVQALATVEERRLRQARLDLGATLLGELTLAARVRPRDAFGRLTGDDGNGFARAWLSAAIYQSAATRAFTEASWLG